MPKKYYLGSRKYLVNLGYTHTSINKQLIKEERIKTEPLPSWYFNTDGTKSRKYRVI